MDGKECPPAANEPNEPNEPYRSNGPNGPDEPNDETLASRPDSALGIARTLSPLIVLSPHYDDAVFSCGGLLAAVPGSTVVTVYTGLPKNADAMQTDWDRRCGFSSAREAMRCRADENREALAALRARGMDLDFLDSQYAHGALQGADLLGDTLAATLTRMHPAAVLFPLGLFHEDHIRISNVLLTICPRFPGIRWLAYEDIPYNKQAARVRKRIGELANRGIVAAALRLNGAGGDKSLAVHAYRSQFRGLGHADGGPILRHAERFWRIQCEMEFL